MRHRILAGAALALVALVASSATAPLQAVNTRKWDPTCACFREVTPRDAVAPEEKPDAIAKATKEMERHEGFFDLYLGEDGEIWITVPESLLGRMILVVGTTSRGDASRMLLNMPMGDAAFEFRLNHDGERIDLVAPQLTLRIDDDSALAEAFSQGVWDGVTITSMEPEATREAVEADEEAGTEAVEAAYLLDVTSWIMGGVLGGGELFRYFTGGNAKPDPDRSRLVSAAAYPDNLEFELELALSVKFSIESIPAPGTLPIGMHLSVVLLPEEPMVGRYSDDRAGYFSTSYYDMGVQTTDGRVARLAHRWRLEKADPEAEVSDPVTPLTFYVDPTVPEQWRPYVAEGIEKWNKAYLAAGFSNAVRAVLPGDEDWPDDYAVGDARYSTVSWAPSIASTFAIGPSNVDPRSGEIINADIVFMSTWIQSWTGDWERKASDLLAPPSYAELRADYEEWLAMPEALKERLCLVTDISAGGDLSPFMMRSALMADGVIAPGQDIPEEYIGEALVEVVMHEVGHTLGLRHNFTSSHDIPWESLNDQAYTQEHGLVSSVMDYARANITSDRDAQGDYYSRVVGDYDVFVIRYGYTEVEGEEHATAHPDLMAIAAENTASGHSYSTDEDNAGPFGWDPTNNYWDLSDDPISFYEDRLILAENLREGMEDRTVSEGEDWSDYIYGVLSLVGDAYLGGQYMAKYIGGHEMSRAHRGDPDAPAPISFTSPADQRRALSFITDLLQNEAFIPNADAYPYMVQSFWAWGPGSRSARDMSYDIHQSVLGRRMTILYMLFQGDRMDRVRDNAWSASAAGETPLTVAEIVGAVTDAIWGSDLAASPPTDSFNRDLQSAWVDMLLGYIGSNPDMDALGVSGAIEIHDSAAAALEAGGLDDMTEAHYRNLVHLIDRVLDLD